MNIKSYQLGDISTDDPQKVIRAIKQNPSLLNVEMNNDLTNHTPIAIQAAILGHIDILTLITTDYPETLKQGDYVSIELEAAIEAIEHKNLAAANILINNTPELLQQQTADDLTLAHLAAIRGEWEWLQNIYAKDSTVLLQQDKDANTLAHIAAYHKRYDILIDMATVNPTVLHQRNKQDHTVPIVIIADQHYDQQARVDTLKSLIEIDPSILEYRYSGDMTLLHIVLILELKIDELVEHIIDRYPMTLGHQGDFDETALTIATENGIVDTVRYIIKNHPTTVEQFRSRGSIMTFHAAQESVDTATMKMLYCYLANDNVRDQDELSKEFNDNLERSKRYKGQPIAFNELPNMVSVNNHINNIAEQLDNLRVGDNQNPDNVAKIEQSLEKLADYRDRLCTIGSFPPESSFFPQVNDAYLRAVLIYSVATGDLQAAIKTVKECRQVPDELIEMVSEQITKPLLASARDEPDEEQKISIYTDVFYCMNSCGLVTDRYSSQVQSHHIEFNQDVAQAILKLYYIFEANDENSDDIVDTVNSFTHDGADEIEFKKIPTKFTIDRNIAQCNGLIKQLQDAVTKGVADQDEIKKTSEKLDETTDTLHDYDQTLSKQIVDLGLYETYLSIKLRHAIYADDLNAAELVINQFNKIPSELFSDVATLASKFLFAAKEQTDRTMKNSLYAKAGNFFAEIGDRDAYYAIRFGETDIKSDEFADLVTKLDKFIEQRDSSGPSLYQKDLGKEKERELLQEYVNTTRAMLGPQPADAIALKNAAQIVDNLSSCHQQLKATNQTTPLVTFIDQQIELMTTLIDERVIELESIKSQGLSPR